ncbi:MAG: GNAT family N-acetyltransferase [Chloroflexi bacterium]|nr:GNAT family N-acetyltransferase [Chloroflexota bacterium]
MVVRIRALTTADIPAGQRLRAQAGWNQTAADWQRLLAWEPEGCWVAERDGQVLGTTSVTTYGQRIAWVGMVLVDEAHRGQGIGKALLTHALAYLDRLGVETVALDSTPAGQPLYQRLGFAEQFELARWRGPFPTLAGAASLDAAHGTADPEVIRSRSAVVRPLQVADLPVLAAYDAGRFGVDRAHVLGALVGGHPATCFVAELEEAIQGYALSRPGARAWHLGPLAADAPETAEALIRASLAAATPPAELVMDAITPNAAAVQLSERLDLTLVRPFIRMTRGAPPPAIDLARVYTSAGPELG